MESFQKFLMKHGNYSNDQVNGKTLIVTSSKEHAENKPLLKKVDNKTNPIEFIFSVSMLSEGWDVKNVFQIVPHEKKAFNSKLLISQVLGRGLRIPLEYPNQQPTVRIFNHDKWYKEIKGLVDEVLEREKRISSYPVQKDKDYNFFIHNIDYDKKEEISNYEKQGSYKFDKELIAYSPQSHNQEGEVTFVSVKDPHSQKNIEIKKRIRFKQVDEVVNEVRNKISLWSDADDKDYLKEFSEEKIKQIIENSLKKIGENKQRVSEENVQKTLQAFGVIRRPGSKNKIIRYKANAKDIEKVNTESIKTSRISLSALYKDGTIYYDDNTFKLSEENDVRIIRELEEEQEEGTLKFNSALLKKISNSYNFKTPLNFVAITHKPERLFINRLIKEENAKCIDSWIKSKDTGFYSIDYSWRKGEHPKNGKFNPDFFIKIKNNILMIEIKADEDIKEENQGKVKYAKKHVKKLNQLQKEKQYYFWMISPKDFGDFFDCIRNNNLNNFISSLENELDEL
jgi:type III restriction enzyme